MNANMQAPWPSDARYLRTGPLLVDLCYRSLECDGKRHELQQRIFELLLLFLAKPNALHTRAALFQQLWPGVIVEDANLSQSVWLLRRALGERGKYWIRTIAKGGYVFEPPGPVEWLPAHPDEEKAVAEDASRADERIPPPAAPAPLPATPIASAASIPASAEAPAPRATARRRWRLPAWAAAAAALAVVAGLVFTLTTLRERRAAGATAAARLAVAVIRVDDPAAGTRWPVRLLHDWLRWKLSSLPQVNFLSESELAAHADPTAPQLVLISAAGAPDAASAVTLRARLQGRGGERLFEQHGPLTRVPEMVDALSAQVLAQLVPARAKPWPALALDAGVARRYAEAAEAFDRRDWQAAAERLEDIVADAPRFGLARLQLARTLARLSRARAAVTQMESAQSLLQPLPAEAARALQAARLAMEPARYREALAAMERLSRRHPGRKDYLLERARLLTTAGEPRQAAQLLAATDWRNDAFGTRLSHLLTLADVDLALGDVEASHKHARIAERLARQAGNGWELERASALMNLAIGADDDTAVRHYREAARLREAAGNQTGALYARFMADAQRAPAEVDQETFDALLAKARESGHPRMEIALLQTVAMQHGTRGDYARARRYLEQAWTTAQTAGDTVARDTLDMQLIGEDVRELRLDSARQRLRRLQDTQAQGNRALQLALYEAMLANARGQASAAVGVLDRIERSLRSDGRSPAVLSSLSCERGSYRLRSGDLAGAREDWKRCDAPGFPAHRLMAAIGRAETELMAGDRAAARALLEPLGPQMDAMPGGNDRWVLALLRSALLTRAGHPEQALATYRRIAPLLPAQGATDMRTELETGMAEAEAALGQWEASRKHRQAARRLYTGQIWAYDARLRLLDIADARAAGHAVEAMDQLRALHAQAHRLGDVGTLLQTHTLLPDGFAQGTCSKSRRDQLVAQTGMRGAGADWLAHADTAIASASVPL